MFSVVDRVQLIVPLQLGQLLRIDPIALIAVLQQSCLSWIAHYQAADVRLEQVVQPGGRCPLFKGQGQSSTQSLDEL